MVRTSHNISSPEDAKLRQILDEMDAKHMKNEPTLLFGGGPLKEYISSGNSAAFPPVHLLEDMRETGGSLVGGKVNRVHKATRWSNFVRDLIPKGIRDAVTKKAVSTIEGAGFKKVAKNALKTVNRAVNKRIKKVVEKSSPKVVYAEEIPYAEDYSDLPEVPKESGAGYAHHSMVKRRKNAAGKKPSLRNMVVKKVMKEQGLKLMAASAYVKKHKLYVKDSSRLKPKEIIVFNCDWVRSATRFS